VIFPAELALFPLVTWEEGELFYVQFPQRESILDKATMQEKTCVYS
jgi:hypothetical protein